MVNEVKRKGMDIAFDLPEVGAAGKKTVAASAGTGTGRAPAQKRMRTGVGIINQRILEGGRLENEIERLKVEAAQLRKERGAVRLDAASIVASAWANRHADSFAGADFDAFKSEIEDAGGNVQPIKVRPLAAPRADGTRYEIVFGHRRHRACLELGLPVLAVIEEMDDAQLFVEMERENRNRVGLSAWEQGRMYQQALDAGLFASNRKLATAIGRDYSTLSKALRVARLPQEIVSAFASPNDIQFRWVGALEAALQAHSGECLTAARAIATGAQPKPAAAEIFRALTQRMPREGEERGAVPRLPDLPAGLPLGGGQSATMKVDAKGRVIMRFPVGALTSERLAKLERVLQDLCS